MIESRISGGHVVNDIVEARVGDDNFVRQLLKLGVVVRQRARREVEVEVEVDEVKTT